MYTNLDLFFRAQYLAFCKTKFSLRRWAYVIFFTMLYWLMWIVVAFGRLLDRLPFRPFLRQEVREPVFIIAPPRSGTTREPMVSRRTMFSVSMIGSRLV